MDILNRIARIVRATAEKNLEELEKVFNEGRTMLDERLDEWERKLNLDQETPKSPGERNKNEFTGKTYPTQVVEDLAVFGLTPPASLEAVKKVRNSEVKKYHSDLFMHDLEKQETGKQIMQIYNSAYERLKKYYAEVK